MKSPYGNVVLITGASSGIGKAMAEYLLERGFKVYGTSRKPAPDNTIIEKENGFIKMLRMDVCSNDSVISAVSQIMAEEGRIDIVINNAGMGIAGSVEDMSPEEVFSQMDTNFLGTHRVIRQVAPIMRKQGDGLIINVSSVAAQFPIPFQSMYCASKIAMEAVSDALRTELKPYGVKVSIIEPGDTKTSFTERRITARAAENSVYKKNFDKSLGVMIRDETNGPDPMTVARKLDKIIFRKNPPLRVICGIQYVVFVFLKRLLPAKLVSYVISRMY